MLGSRIRKLRKDNNLTLRELGEKLNLSFSILAMYERGERTPPVDKLLLLADFFSVSLDYLLGKSDKKNNSLNIAVSSEDYESDERDKVYKLLNENSKEEFICLKARDESMEEGRIQPGDFVYAIKNEKVKEGDIAIVVIKKNNHYYIRRVFFEKDKIILKPENSDYDQEIYNKGEVEIKGKVVKVIFEV